MFNGYRVTMTAAGGGRNPHVRRVFLEFDDMREVVQAAWRERYMRTPELSRIVPRDAPGSFSVLSAGGGVTFVEVERI